MTIHFRDLNGKVVEAWRRLLSRFDDRIIISQGDILTEKADAIVSPANSFGFMDGGIDAVYARRFPNVQQTLQTAINVNYQKELLVGQACIVPTFDKDIPYIISAPTMRVPGDISNTVNVYLAFRAVLKAIDSFNQANYGVGLIRSILCPGLGTLTGNMPPERSAYQIGKALTYNDEFPRTLYQASMNHLAMIGED